MTASKADLRKHFLSLRQSVAEAERQLWSSEILDRLFGSEAWQAATLVCGYVSIKGEPDLSAVAVRAAAEGKLYALPRTLTGADQGDMCFCRLHPHMTHADLPQGRFRIPEPPCDCPEVTRDDFARARALIIVPGLAFDHSGYRIGYGGGYYDRFLTRLSEDGIHAVSVGLAFSPCTVPSLPKEPHDRPVDLLINERKVIHTHE